MNRCLIRGPSCTSRTRIRTRSARTAGIEKEKRRREDHDRDLERMINDPLSTRVGERQHRDRFDQEDDPDRIVAHEADGVPGAGCGLAFENQERDREDRRRDCDWLQPALQFGGASVHHPRVRQRRGNASHPCDAAETSAREVDDLRGKLGGQPCWRRMHLVRCRTLSTHRWVGKPADTHLMRDQNFQGDDRQPDGEVKSDRDEGRASTQAL